MTKSSNVLNTVLVLVAGALITQGVVTFLRVGPLAADVHTLKLDVQSVSEDVTALEKSHTELATAMSQIGTTVDIVLREQQNRTENVYSMKTLAENVRNIDRLVQENRADLRTLRELEPRLASLEGLLKSIADDLSRERRSGR